MENAKALENYPDLQDLLNQALSKVPDYCRITYCGSERFSSFIDYKEGLLLGGVHSPVYIKKKDHLIESCYNVRVIISETIDSNVQEWLPFIEGLANVHEGLLIITNNEIRNEELYKTLLVNHLRGSLRCIILKPPKSYIDNLQQYAEKFMKQERNKIFKTGRLPYLRSGQIPSPNIHEDLPLLEQVMARKDSSIAFPKFQEYYKQLLSKIAIINVGGGYSEEQDERMAAIAKVLYDKTALSIQT